MPKMMVMVRWWCLHFYLRSKSEVHWMCSYFSNLTCELVRVRFLLIKYMCAIDRAGLVFGLFNLFPPNGNRFWIVAFHDSWAETFIRFLYIHFIYCYSGKFELRVGNIYIYSNQSMHHGHTTVVGLCSV